MIALLLFAALQGVASPGEPPRLRNPEGVIGLGDYPAEAMRHGETGVVTVAVQVSDKGKVTGCDVTETSGSDALDSATCTLVRKRGQFDPATDFRHQPVAGVFRMASAWGLDDRQPKANTIFDIKVAALPDGYREPVKVRTEYDSLGRLSRCAIVTGGGSFAAVRAACEHIVPRTIAAPKSRSAKVEAVAVRYATIAFSIGAPE